MSSERHPLRGDTDHLLQAAIFADRRQRHLLSHLLEQSGPMTERELAVHLAAHEAEKPPADITEEDLEQVRWELYHRYLPMLETAGWIERYPVGIAATEQLSFGGLKVSLSELEDLDDSSWEALAALLARPRRQRVASIIVEHQQPLYLEELGAELAASEQSLRTDGGEEPTLLAMLHHVDLPALETVGLIEYDRDERSITRKRRLTTLLDRISTR